jgi:His-Xaa-Ser system radical SAM maturase HxsC
MRQLKATFGPGVAGGVWRVVNPEALAAEWEPDLRLLVMVSNPKSTTGIERLAGSGLPNVSWIAAHGLEQGDVVSVSQERQEVRVLYRESDRHHSLFVTNRCNSYCLMCSQPPTKHDDSWLIEEAISVARHIRVPPLSLGISGGEPLLLGADLGRVIDAIAQKHPDTPINVLTNGRLFSKAEIAQAILPGLEGRVTWFVPLYGHADFLHDYVVQARGAFEETLEGLLVLQTHQQAIQLRIVLIKPVLETLSELCTFIGRNLPFVREVALMACEPIGFALGNRDACQVDLADWSETLVEACSVLNRHGVPYVLMNAPLCALPAPLWAAASRSISDWKNTYVDECDSCAVKNDCAGLFSWHERGWRPTRITPIRGLDHEQVC